MGKKSDKLPPRTLSIVHDGQLTQEEALNALKVAAQSATESLPAALAQCKTQEESNKVQTDRDTVVLAYLNSLKKSLINTSSQFEKVAGDLETEAKTVKQKSTTLQNVDQAIGLFTGLVRLAASLALAFG